MAREGRPGEGTRRRITRRGEEVATEMSSDGQTWREHTRRVVSGLNGEGVVGPVALHTTDRTSTATFSDYTLDPLPGGRK